MCKLSEKTDSDGVQQFNAENGLPLVCKGKECLFHRITRKKRKGWTLMLKGFIGLVTILKYFLYEGRLALRVTGKQSHGLMGVKNI